MEQGEPVRHRDLGEGTVVGSRHRGLELQVRFESGRTLWVRSEEVECPVAPVQPTPLFPAAAQSPPPSEPCRDRALIEALRLGIVPQRDVADFTIGRDEEVDHLDRWLLSSVTNALLVVGEYGSGKTHFLEYAYRRALQQGFAVASVSVDYNESPFHKPKRIYGKCARSFRFPYQDGPGIGDYRGFLRLPMTQAALCDHMYFERIRGTNADAIWEWIEAREATGRPAATRFENYNDYPCLHDTANAGNIYCNLLTGLSSAAHFIGLRGLVLFFDEAEAINYYAYNYQQERGRSFLEALIRAADDDDDLAGYPFSSGLDYCKLGDSRLVQFIYERPTFLKVAFACTPAACDEFDRSLNVDRIDLEALDDGALQAIAESVCGRYSAAYNSPCCALSPDPRFDTLRARAGSTRLFVKGCVEALDLARLTRPETNGTVAARGTHRAFLEIRRRLPRSWPAFFTRFGKLTPVQLATIPRILDGASVVVASPTASGKTEAVTAPVAEQVASQQWGGMSVIYVVPTRALANDTLSRVGDPLRTMGIDVTLKHGDKPHLPSRGLPNWLITTPESLDSLLCRHTAAFADLRTLIIDEIHLLDGTFRGDQLRILINRARQLTRSATLTTHLLSATLSSPLDLAERYAVSPQLIEVPGRRDIDHHSVASLEQATDLAKHQGWRKILCFCNMREAVEHYASKLGPIWTPYPVLAHHGSLDRRVREEAERVMQESQAAICVSTSTLEIGVDIGDVDAVVLLEVPWSVSSFLQRVGRGNRRSGVINAVTVASSEDEQAAFDAMVDCAIRGELAVDAYEPKLSVCVQQLFSYLYQNPQGASIPELVELVSPLCSTAAARDIIANLLTRGDLESRQSLVFATTSVMDMGEIGKIHSNIPDSQRFRVVDEGTGRDIGTISGSFDQVFVLARVSWIVTGVTGNIVRVRRFKGKAAAATFATSREDGAFHSWLPPSLQ